MVSRRTVILYGCAAAVSVVWLSGQYGGDGALTAEPTIFERTLRFHAESGQTVRYDVECRELVSIVGFGSEGEGSGGYATLRDMDPGAANDGDVVVSDGLSSLQFDTSGFAVEVHAPDTGGASAWIRYVTGSADSCDLAMRAG